MTSAPTALDAALARLAADAGPDAQAAVHRALLDAEVLVPMGDGGRVVIDRGGPGRPPSVLAFSGEHAAALWNRAAGTVPVPARELLAFATQEGLARVTLDAGGPVSVTLDSWEVRRLAAGELPTPGSEDRLAIALPRSPLPVAFVAAGARAAAALEGVEGLSVYEADPVRGRRHLVVGVHGDAGVANVVDALHDALAPLAPDDALVNFTAVADGPPFAALEPDATIWRRPA